MADLESIIRPFGPGAAASAFEVSGQGGSPSGHKIIGYPGGTLNFSYTFDSTTTFVMGKKNKEKAPKSQALQTALGSASS